MKAYSSDDSPPNRNDPGKKLKMMMDCSDSDSSEMGRMDEEGPGDMLGNLGADVNQSHLEMYRASDANLNTS